MELNIPMDENNTFVVQSKGLFDLFQRIESTYLTQYYGSGYLEIGRERWYDVPAAYIKPVSNESSSEYGVLLGTVLNNIS